MALRRSGSDTPEWSQKAFLRKAAGSLALRMVAAGFPAQGRGNPEGTANDLRPYGALEVNAGPGNPVTSMGRQSSISAHGLKGLRSLRF